jgi:biotin carboxylase
MTTRLLVTSAGTGPANNLVRSLQAGDASLVVAGCHDDPFVLGNSAADPRYLTPSPGHRGWTAALRHIVKSDRIALVIPATDADVARLSRARAALGARLFLPRAGVLDLCADKYRLTAALRRNGIAAPATWPVTRLDDVERIFDRLSEHPQLWCRIRGGAGSMGAIPVRRPEQARQWIAYWRDMRGVPVRSFTLSEYLPGRDFACQSVWKDGRLVLVKTFERLSYLATGSRPSHSSVAALAKIVRDPRVVDLGTRAIRLLDRRASGVFSVDLKEDAGGTPCITEINAGRFTSATNLFDLTGKHSMVTTYVRVALGDAPEIDEPYDVAEGYYMLRGIDAPPRIFHADEVLDAIQDARRPGRVRREHPPREASEGEARHGHHGVADAAARPGIHHRAGHRTEPRDHGPHAQVQEGAEDL